MQGPPPRRDAERPVEHKPLRLTPEGRGDGGDALGGAAAAAGSSVAAMRSFVPPVDRFSK